MKNLDRDTVLGFSVHAIINMQDQSNAARCLFEKGFYGQSRSTAITALEELGKFVLTLSHLAGEISEAEFIQRIRSHHPKQRWGNLIAYLAPISQRLIEQNSETTSGCELLTRISESNLDGLVKELQENESELEVFADYLVSGQVERERQDGWYVSLSMKNETLHISYPRMVGREDAENVLRLLSHFDHEFSGSSFNLASLLGYSEGEIEKLHDDQIFEEYKRMIDQVAKSFMSSFSEPIRTT